ncbi:MAG: host attachment protein [Maricaulaceae bacterium]|jgi:protein required for attachment to host cells
MSAAAPITTATWVAVFDGGRAATFENEGFDDAPNLRYVFGARTDNPPPREHYADRQGRRPTPAGGRAAIERTDAHEAAETAFIEDYAHEIDAAASAGRFDRLVVIAPGGLMPVFLGAAPHASKLLAATRAGDFAHAPVEEIERAFREALADPR